MRVFMGVTSIMLGAGMVGSWVLILASNQMPELHAAPAMAWMHIAAEMLTAFLLLLSGYGMLAQRLWWAKLHLVSLGMLLYAVVQASGHYAQLRATGIVLVFGLVGALAVLFMVQVARMEREKAV
jgi:hypothetical protein